MNKKILRKQIRTKLQNMTTEEINNKNIQIYNKIINTHEYKNAKKIFTYISMEKEAETKQIIQHAINHKKEIFVPKINLKEKKIEVYNITSLNELKLGAYNIEEPDTHISYEHNFNIIIIPGLGFDKSNNRLGRGSGYFDKFLQAVKGIKIGLCYKEQLFKKIPVEKHDIQMDFVITD